MVHLISPFSTARWGRAGTRAWRLRQIGNLDFETLTAYSDLRASKADRAARALAEIAGMGFDGLFMKVTAKRAALVTLVVGGIVVAALALWKLKLVLALLFFAFIIAAAMRPGIEWLKGHGVPRGVGLLLHYLGLFALVGLFLGSWCRGRSARCSPRSEPTRRRKSTARRRARRASSTRSSRRSTTAFGTCRRRGSSCTPR